VSVMVCGGVSSVGVVAGSTSWSEHRLSRPITGRHHLLFVRRAIRTVTCSLAVFVSGRSHCERV
jgi:hypothetical protein